MSIRPEDFAEKIRRAEEAHFADHTFHRYRLTHHLMPPVGWLNDPNGLCWFKGRYHVFFQYSPLDAEGGLKCWGHYSSGDLVSWRYEGAALLPDSPRDSHGAYSGSALVKDGRLHLFYTGNVKLDGDYDYINNGRRANTLHVESADGIHFGEKETAISFEEYPQGYTAHIRDPKVWEEAGEYRMVLGGRKKEEKGAVLFYRSSDLKRWEFEKEMTTGEPFGYMWECPDFFTLEGRPILSVSPQGLKRETYRYQNVYQSGYFILGTEEDAPEKENFREWDMGFDFYAPQTFTDPKGRRLLIGWMGMGDADGEYRNPTVREEGWQHCLTLPRELTVRGDRVCQYPLDELKALRKNCRSLGGADCSAEVDGAFDLELRFAAGESGDAKMGCEAKAGGSRDMDGYFALGAGHVKVSIGEALALEYEDGRAYLILSREAGAGRKVRRAFVEKLTELRIVGDTSAVEIYLNRGETVFSSRYYPRDSRQRLTVETEVFSGELWELRHMGCVYAGGFPGKIDNF